MYAQREKQSDRKYAFTMAEILITLGIIGIVTAMTIPTFIQNYNTKVWNTSAKVFEKKLEDALKTMNSLQTLSGHTTTESFVEELSKHFKTNKICNNEELSDCFSDIVYWGGGEASLEEINISILKKAKNLGQKEWKTNVVGVQFANGTSALIAYNPTETCQQSPLSNQVSVDDCLAILYDTSADKNPNTRGKDLRSNQYVTYLGTGCVFEVGDTCYTTAPFTPKPISKTECEAIKDSLGISECGASTDYWAGAAKTCGGLAKMPTEAQLKDLAHYIYGMNIASSGYTYCPKDSNGEYTKCVDENKILSLGFKYTSGSTLYVWAGAEYNSSNAYSRQFSPTNTYRRNWGRNHNFLQAMCIE